MDIFRKRWGKSNDDEDVLREESTSGGIEEKANGDDSINENLFNLSKLNSTTNGKVDSAKDKDSSLKQKIIPSEEEEDENDSIEDQLLKQNFFTEDVNNENESEDDEPYDLEETLRRFIQKDKELIQKLTEISEQIKASRKNCNIAKTTGVSLSGTGTVMSVTALCLAPFTAGASLALIGIPAVVTSIVGGLTSAGANLAEGIISKSCLREAQVFQEEQVKLALELTKFKERTRAIVDQLVNWGWDEDQAIESVLKSIKSGLLSPVASQEEEDIFADAVVVDEELCKHESPEENPKIRRSGGTSKIRSGILGFSAQVGQAVHKFTPIEAGLTAALFRTTTTTAASTTLKGVVQGVATAAGVAFTVVDIVYLVKSWKNDHPLIPQIELIIAALEEDIKDCEKILQVYEIL